MRSSKHKLRSANASADRIKQVLQKVTNRAGQDHPLNDLLPILEKENSLSAWLNVGQDEEADLFIILANQLSDIERKALAEFSDFVLSSSDDLAKKIADVEKENRYLKSLTLTDALTGLYNYRFFAKQLDVEIARTIRTGQPCSLMMIDLDDFKLINDTLGHDEGNKFLVLVSQTIEERLRPTDIMCRYGGDEFAIIMPATTLFEAMRIAQRLGESVSNIPPRLDKPFSVSMGLAQYDPDTSAGQGMSSFINMADRALYKAKEGGKNKICYEGKLPAIEKVTSVTIDEKAALLNKDDHE